MEGYIGSSQMGDPAGLVPGYPASVQGQGDFFVAEKKIIQASGCLSQPDRTRFSHRFSGGRDAPAGRARI